MVGATEQARDAGLWIPHRPKRAAVTELRKFFAFQAIVTSLSWVPTDRWGTWGREGVVIWTHGDALTRFCHKIDRISHPERRRPSETAAVALTGSGRRRLPL